MQNINPVTRDLVVDDWFDSVQNRLRLWEEENFPNVTVLEQALGVAEETGELAHALLKMHRGIRSATGNEGGAKDAIGDIAVYLLAICGKTGWDFVEILTDTINKVLERDWNAVRNGEVASEDLVGDGKR